MCRQERCLGEKRWVCSFLVRIERQGRVASVAKNGNAPFWVVRAGGMFVPLAQMWCEFVRLLIGNSAAKPSFGHSYFCNHMFLLK